MTEQQYIAPGLALVHLQRCIQVTGLVKISFYSRPSVFSWYQPTSVLFPLFMLVLSVMCRWGSRSCFPSHNGFKFLYFCHPSSPQSWPWCTPKVSLKRHITPGDVLLCGLLELSSASSSIMCGLWRSLFSLFSIPYSACLPEHPWMFKPGLFLNATPY